MELSLFTEKMTENFEAFCNILKSIETREYNNHYKSNG